ncbi:MAG: altronate hydrolase [Planctomycetota bacterium]|nr:MAG: altronate hydrolase [Planctomycetota bacterium]
MKSNHQSKDALLIDAKDNVAVALQNLKKNSIVTLDRSIEIKEDIQVKHKFALQDLKVGVTIMMYGVIVGKVQKPILMGQMLTVENTNHFIGSLSEKNAEYLWVPPDSKDMASTFSGYDRKDGTVGTSNYWLIVPMVFCQNRNLRVMKESLHKALGYSTNHYEDYVNQLVGAYESNSTKDVSDTADFSIHKKATTSKTFPNIDGIQFLNHDGGCGGDRHDSQTLVQLLAGYICHGNVAGVTVLGLGCEHAQFSHLEKAIHQINPNIQKPINFLSQQKEGTEEQLLKKAIKVTFEGLVEANKIKREEIDVSKLIVGVECGGSDGFSGISSNVVLGEVSDFFVKQGASVILSEFPELCGVEQEIVNRCNSSEISERFLSLMASYESLANSKGSSFSSNPSPGNIKDGLITDAIKSAGAVKKGGASPIVAVLDYTEVLKTKGLNLLCTPGNDVESTTGLVASGAHLILFSTGLGTPTGNPIAPVIKVSSNTDLYQKMNDIIDFDAGPIIGGSVTPNELGKELHELCIKVASGEQSTKAQILNQDDFILWKRGISL